MMRYLLCLVLLFGIHLQLFGVNAIRPKLYTIHITDRNGFTETISNSERMKQYENANFLAQQPYEKVMRIYQRDSSGDVVAYINSYHENGTPKQYLEVLNGRANGNYWEWYGNGNPKLEAFVIGGEADIDVSAEGSWLFDGCCTAWDEKGNVSAHIFYKGGEIEGVSKYYHPNGATWKLLPYSKNELEGDATIYQEDGQLLQKSHYTHGKRDGETIRYWVPDQIAAKETYKDGLLITGLYYNPKGKPISAINEGTGFRPVFGKDFVAEMHEYKNGVEEGEVRIFTPEGNLFRQYYVKDDKLHGQDTEYFEMGPPNRKKISVFWVEGKIQGDVITYYSEGNLQSRREIFNNKKQGILTAWYRDGSLMLIEEYDGDKLVKGEYYRKGESTPQYRIQQGNGVAMFYDSDGNFLNRVTYRNGKPET